MPESWPQTGFPAIATTSGGVSWAIGYADGEAAPWDEVVAATRRIVRSVSIPVTADIEAGFGDTPDLVAKSVADIIEAGAVGIISRMASRTARHRYAQLPMPPSAFGPLVRLPASPACRS